MKQVISAGLIAAAIVFASFQISEEKPLNTHKKVFIHEGVYKYSRLKFNHSYDGSFKCKIDIDFTDLEREDFYIEENLIGNAMLEIDCPYGLEKAPVRLVIVETDSATVVVGKSDLIYIDQK